MCISFKPPLFLEGREKKMRERHQRGHIPATICICAKASQIIVSSVSEPVSL